MAFNTLQTLLALPWALGIGVTSTDALRATTPPAVTQWNWSLEDVRSAFLVFLFVTLVLIGLCMLGIEGLLRQAYDGSGSTSILPAVGLVLIGLALLLIFSSGTQHFFVPGNDAGPKLGIPTYLAWSLLLLIRLQLDMVQLNRGTSLRSGSGR